MTALVMLATVPRATETATVELIELMAKSGGSPSFGLRYKTKSAAFCALLTQRPALAQRLRDLEPRNPLHCDLCGQLLQRKERIRFLGDQIAQGRRTNPLLTELYLRRTESINLLNQLSTKYLHQINTINLS